MPKILHQRNCLKGLTAWRRAYRLIKQHTSQVRAVSQLMQFAKEQEALLGVPLDQVEPTAILEQRMGFPQQRVPKPVPVEPVDAVIPPDFSGVIEGRNVTAPAPVTTFAKLPVAEPTPAPEWPQEIDVHVYGFAPNLKLLRGELPDKRNVSVWRGFRGWRLPSKVKCRIDPSSNPKQPIYSPL